MKKRTFQFKGLGDQIVVANVATAAVALIVASVALVLLQYKSLREAVLDDSKVQAGIISTNSAAALMFRDENAALENLLALNGSPNIVSAATFDHEKVVFATHRKEGDQRPIDSISKGLLRDKHSFSFDHLDVLSEVSYDRKNVGYVVIRVGLRQLYSRLFAHVVLIIGTAAASLVVAYALVKHFQKKIKRAEEELDRLAHIDPVTGLYNRNAFNRMLQATLGRRDRADVGAVSLLLFDLDNFKVINDTLGHASGDLLLNMVGKRIGSVLRQTDIIFRLGGDEFCVILEHSSVQDIDRIATKIIASLSSPFDLENHEVYTTASIGVSSYPQDAQEAQTLMRNADMAMYTVKKNGRNNYTLFNAEMNKEAQKKASVENDLRKALEKGELSLHYQPQICLKTNTIFGVEALLRWKSPTRGMMSPADFIPIAEESGLILPIGLWVLETACEQAYRWSLEGMRDLHLSVNLSVRQIKEKHSMDELIAVIERQQARSRDYRLELEITESLLMERNHANVEFLKRLKEMGVGLSIDDFGTGYSSLAYLQRFPATQLKIDKSFVQNVPGEGAPISSAIIALAHGLGQTVVAEGVETEAQAQFLRTSGCDVAQGFYFAKPMPQEECSRFLKTFGVGQVAPRPVEPSVPPPAMGGRTTTDGLGDSVSPFMGAMY